MKNPEIMIPEMVIPETVIPDRYRLSGQETADGEISRKETFIVPEDFDSERYFTLHPDYDISSLAIRLCADNVILSKSLQVEVTPYTMQEQINHMLLDFRNEYIMQHIKLLTKEISEASNEPGRQIELMAELKEAQQLRSMIARKIGNSVVARRL
jgi:DNA primase